jgi:hypothetical protein
MSFVRRLALGLLTVALLASAAVAAGYAMRLEPGTSESSSDAAYDEHRAHDPRPPSRPSRWS